MPQHNGLYFAAASGLSNNFEIEASEVYNIMK
jgi:hypothetical protein